MPFPPEVVQAVVAIEVAAINWLARVLLPEVLTLSASVAVAMCWFGAAEARESLHRSRQIGLRRSAPTRGEASARRPGELRGQRSVDEGFRRNPLGLANPGR
jgi:hypothetical protein